VACRNCLAAVGQTVIDYDHPEVREGLLCDRIEAPLDVCCLVEQSNHY
jgi:hypothetical protein